MVRDFSSLLALWTPQQLQRLLGVPKTTVGAMYQRRSIGPAHWSRIIELAAARGEPITADDLLRFRDIKIGKAVAPSRVRKVKMQVGTSPVP